MPADKALDFAGVRKATFESKEALALVNGTGASTSMASLVTSDSIMLAHLT